MQKEIKSLIGMKERLNELKDREKDRAKTR